MPGQLHRSFFSRNTCFVARELLGMRLVRLHPTLGRMSGRIVEAEAYCTGDSASHAYKGRTARNAPMFGEAGFSYVYFTYGMHFCFNIVTESIGIPAAVLVRALEPREGIQAMIDNRMSSSAPALTLRDLCRGPARLCKSMGIDNTMNSYDLTQPVAQLFVEKDVRIPDDGVQVSPRIRVNGSIEARTVLWRWTIKDCLFVSK